MVRIERSYPAPASLEAEKKKASGTYRTEEVIQRLRRDFNDKCYICEMGHLQNPEIEHRLPHHNGMDRDREFDWDNLFWACSDCNKAKNKQKYEAGIIDCCKTDPEQILTMRFEDGSVTTHVSVETNDDIIRNTETLLNEVFNKDSKGMRNIRSQERYRLLLTELNTFYRLLQDYERPEHSPNTEVALEEILNKRSSFAQLKRDYIRMHKETYPGLLALL